MRYYILLLLVVMFGDSMAQKVIDHAYLKCQYKYTYIRDTLTGKSDNDLLALQIGHKISKCYSQYSVQVDSILALPNSDDVLLQHIKQAISAKTDYPHKRMKAYVYKNYPNGKMTVTDGVTMQDYVYEDSLDLQNWDIKDSIKTIMGYSVQKAECDFRGRHWTAWFTEDIPVNNGPWKLGNLPGLIMEAYSDGMQNHFVINGLEKTANEPIVFSKTYVGSRKYVRTTRKKFLRSKMKYLCDISGHIFMETGIDIGVNEKQKIIRYDLLERDYNK
ncbi:MAG: GLPGLI family protein [Prevotella sp.]|nr:GLPGLI family protein [Prevotella sp.]